MSIEDAKACLERIQSDETFRQSFSQATDKDERVELVRQAGFEFTRDEMLSLVPDDHRRELSPEELEAVAGGMSSYEETTIIATVVEGGAATTLTIWAAYGAASAASIA